MDWNNFLREICAADLLANPIAIGGPNTTVEVDDSLFTRRKNHQGRQLPPQWVFGGICRETRECFMYTVRDRRAANLLPIIQGSIRPGTAIMSDMWADYGSIQAMGYAGLTVNHTYEFVDPITGAHTKRGKLMGKCRMEKKQNGTHRSMLDSYLCEWMWRQRSRNNDLFDKIIADIVTYFPPN